MFCCSTDITEKAENHDQPDRRPAAWKEAAASVQGEGVSSAVRVVAQGWTAPERTHAHYL